MNNITPEMKNTLEGINSRIPDAEEQTRELEDRMVAITTKGQNEETERAEDTLRDLWENIKCISIQIQGSYKNKTKSKIKKTALRKYFERL